MYHPNAQVWMSEILWKIERENCLLFPVWKVYGAEEWRTLIPLREFSPSRRIWCTFIILIKRTIVWSALELSIYLRVNFLLSELSVLFSCCIALFIIFLHYFPFNTSHHHNKFIRELSKVALFLNDTVSHFLYFKTKGTEKISNLIRIVKGAIINGKWS